MYVYTFHIRIHSISIYPALHRSMYLFVHARIDPSFMSQCACALRHRLGDWKANGKASLGGGAAKILKEQTQRQCKASLDGGAAKILKQTERTQRRCGCSGVWRYSSPRCDWGRVSPRRFFLGAFLASVRGFAGGPRQKVCLLVCFCNLVL